MDNEDLKSVPYIVFESSQARSERYIKKLIIALVIAIIINLVSNLAWLYAWNQYDYIDEESVRAYIQDGAGINIIGDSNDVTGND